MPKFEEWSTDGRGEKIKKLREVMIYDHEASMLNEDEVRTRVTYVKASKAKPEPAEQDPDQEEKAKPGRKPRTE